MSRTTLRDPTERINWGTSVPFVAAHVAVLSVFLVHPGWRDLLACGVLYYVRMFFLSAGYHRYFAHRAYRLGRPAQFLMALGGTTAAQKGPLWWAGHHREHHRYADTDRDPHSPRKGVWWSHAGWILCDKYKAIDYAGIRDFAAYPELRFLDRHFLFAPVALGVACLLLGGWSMLVTGYLLSTVLLWHGTFIVNSVAHLVGSRRYETPDTSRNSLLVALLTNGEGWHNNHHHYMASARHGFFWWELDVSYCILRLLGAMGIVRDLRTPSPRVLRARLVGEQATEAAAQARDPVRALVTEAPGRSGRNPHSGGEAGR